MHACLYKPFTAATVSKLPLPRTLPPLSLSHRLILAQPFEYKRVLNSTRYSCTYKLCIIRTWYLVAGISALQLYVRVALLPLYQTSFAKFARMHFAVSGKPPEPEFSVLGHV